MSAKNIQRLLDTAEGDMSLEADGICWLLRELGGALSETIDEKGAKVPSSLRTLERAVREVLTDAAALDALEDKLNP